MQTTLTSVASAAVISGDLIIGLSDGSIINCGSVQGPQGLTGDQGPIGPTGLRGTDGNTIHTVQGTPDTTLGKDGDFAINVKFWEIYGPRSGGAWGTPTPLRGNKRMGSSEQKNNIFGSNSQGDGSGGGTGVMQNTTTLPLSGAGRKTIDAPGGDIVKEKKGCKNQANINNWAQAGLMALDAALPVAVLDALPAAGDYEGELVFADSVLYIWAKGAWVEISGGGKESQPYIDFEQFKVIERTDRFDYDPLFETNPIATYTWEYQINLDAAADPTAWTKVDDLPQSDLDAIGWYGSVSKTHLRLNYTSPKQDITYPNASVRFYVWSELNGVENEYFTCELPAWKNGECDVPASYEDAWIKERFAINTEQITWLQNEIRDANVEIKKGRYDQAAINAELTSEVEARKRADSDLQAQIDELEPGTSYDDSDIREKLEEEKVFRVAGDEALNTKIDLTEDKIVSVNEKLEEEKALRVAGDEINKAAIDSLETQTEDLRQADEIEKAARIAEDAKIAANLVEEARIRADEDYKLLARINGIEIPDMPGDYDDSGLRELIEQESALRASGDAGLHELTKTNSDRIEETDNALAVERQDRVAADLAIQADLRTESEARQRGDSDLQAQIDALDSSEGVDPETFAADQKRQDDAQGAERAARVENDLKLAKELEDYKEEVKAEQEAQDDRLDALEAIDPVNVLNDLDDVDISGIRSAAAIEDQFLWLHFRLVPGEGEFGVKGTALVVNVSAWNGIDPGALFDRIQPGSIVNLNGRIAGSPIVEDCVVATIEQRSGNYEITFEEVPALVVELIALSVDVESATLEIGYVGSSTPGPGPTPPPTPPPSVTAGTFLGYDDGKKLWVPQTLDVSGGGVTDLSDYYTKSQVDDKIDAIDVDLTDYYTKSEVNAIESVQDTRLDALEAGGGGGGPADLSNYYTKAETYNTTELDTKLGNEMQMRLTGDKDLQDQIDDLKNDSPSVDLNDLETKVTTNTAGILKNKQDIASINSDQADQNTAIGNLETAVAGCVAGLDNRYTKDEVDQIVNDIDIPEPDLSNLLVKDEHNKVTADFRIQSATNNDTYISFHDDELGLFNLREPAMPHHAARMTEVTEGDSATLQSAKDHSDSLKVDLDASQDEQDQKIDALEGAAALLTSEVEENASDIAALEATQVVNLNDLQDVKLTTTRERKLRGVAPSGEELLYPNMWGTYRSSAGRVNSANEWTVEGPTMLLNDNIDNKVLFDEFKAKLVAGNTLHLSLVSPLSNLLTTTARLTLSAVTFDGGSSNNILTFTETPQTIHEFLQAARDTENYQLTVSIAEVNVDPPADLDPNDIDKRSNILLGYDVDEKLWTPHKAAYVPLEGGTMTGPLKWQNGDKSDHQFQILPNANDFATNVYFHNGGQGRFRTTPAPGTANYKTHIILDPNNGTPQTKIYQVVDPTADDMAANRGYVDREIAKPATLNWLWDGKKSSDSAPGSGKFYYHEGGSNGIIGYLRFNFESYNGCDMSDGKFNDTNVTIGNGPVGTIWQWRNDTGKWKLWMQFRVQTWRWNFHNHFEIGLSSTNGRGFSEFVQDVKYYVTIGGFF